MTHYYYTPAEICEHGSDGVLVIANQVPVEELRAGLEYARTHQGCSKTLVKTLEREIRRKEQAAERAVIHTQR